MAELSESQQQVYDAIRADPGHHPGDYAEQLKMAPVAVGNAARRLRAEGLIRTDGKGPSLTYSLPRRRAAKRTRPSSRPRRTRAEHPQITPATLVGETVLLVDGRVYLVRLEPIA